MGQMRHEKSYFYLSHKDYVIISHKPHVLLYGYIVSSDARNIIR